MLNRLNSPPNVPRSTAAIANGPRNRSVDHKPNRPLFLLGNLPELSLSPPRAILHRKTTGEAVHGLKITRATVGSLPLLHFSHRLPQQALLLLLRQVKSPGKKLEFPLVPPGPVSTQEKLTHGRNLAGKAFPSRVFFLLQPTVSAAMAATIFTPKWPEKLSPEPSSSSSPSPPEAAARRSGLLPSTIEAVGHLQATVSLPMVAAQAVATFFHTTGPFLPSCCFLLQTIHRSLPFTIFFHPCSAAMAVPSRESQLFPCTSPSSPACHPWSPILCRGVLCHRAAEGDLSLSAVSYCHLSPEAVPCQIQTLRAIVQKGVLRREFNELPCL